MVKDEKGQSLVEMALILPLMLLLLIGIFDFGRILYNYTHLHLANQETVRVAGLGKSDSEVEQFARDYIHIGDPAKLEVAITPDELLRNSGDYVTVELRFPTTLITPFLSHIIPSPFFVETTSTIRVE
jgi:hypothetical protein